MMATTVRLFIIGLIFSPIVYTLECYECDSVEDPECATRPGQQIEVEECSKVEDECVTVIVSGHTRRGCLSRLFPNKYCPEPCERCNTNLCNRNIFPRDRLRCYQCIGADCVKVDTKTNYILPCPVYKENDRCYTNIIRESNVQRGCEHTNLPSSCPNVCLKCNYHGCNNEPGAYEDFCLECRHTSANPNPYCLRNIQPVLPEKHCAVEVSTGEKLHVKPCSNRLMYGHKAKCFTYINRQTQFVQRGCSTAKPFYPTGDLTECYGKNCNNECLPIACSACNATSVANNEQCRRGENLRSERCDTNTFSCFACESPGVLRRGCTNSSFIQSANEACYHCSNLDGCNSKIPLRTCYHCSSKDDIHCASAMWNSNRVGKKICASQTELCVSTVVNKYNMVFVVRGCASTVPDCTEFDPYCVKCNGSFCNDVPIQIHWTPITKAIDLKSDILDARSSQGVQRLNYLLVYLIASCLIFCVYK